MLTCDLAHGEVVSGSPFRVPGRPLDAVGCPRLEVLKCHRGAGGVELVAAAGALPDDAQGVEDRVRHRGPVHVDGAVVGGGGDQLWCQHHCETERMRQLNKSN